MVDWGALTVWLLPMLALIVLAILIVSQLAIDRR
jgi:hypothetical protein